MPSDVSSFATSLARRDALFVAYATAMPRSRNRAVAATAPGMTWSRGTARHPDRR
jgi:hypothetical protein